MSCRYVAFDVETPNSANSRMSAIGITVLEDGAVTAQYHSLVNPEVPFDPFNIALTGITPEMAARAPVFPVLWQEIRPLLEGSLLIAHNAPFDMSVLGRCLRDYHVFWHPFVRYACTCQMSRQLLPQLPNHKLNTLCDYWGLELDHHQAGSDSRACGEIFLYLLEGGAELTPFVRTYDLVEIHTVRAPLRRLSIPPGAAGC